MKYYTKTELFNIFNDVKGVAWGHLTEFYPSLAMLGRIASDRGYAEQISQGQINPNNNNLLGNGLALAGTLGLTVPVIGGALLLLNEIVGGVNLGTFGEISKSGIASNRLREWNVNMVKNYGSPVGNNLPLTKAIQWYIQENNSLALTVPKCVSPTTNCSNEHKQYQIRVSIMREAQESILKIYAEYICTDRLQDFYNTFGSIGNNNNQNNSNNNSGVKSAIPLLIGAGILFSTIKGS
jgi:hypothetical protein